MGFTWKQNPEGAKAVILCSVFTAISIVFTALRLYIRFFQRKNHGFEDYFLIGALITSMGYTSMIEFQRRNGLGMHYWELQDVSGHQALLGLFVSIFCYYTSLFLVKLSLTLQYYRLFSFQPQKGQCIALGFFLLCNWIQCVFATIFVCVPPRKFWDVDVAGHCVNTEALWPFNAALNIVTDFALIILPMPAVRKLNLPIRTKRTLIVVFALGGAGCLISIMRLHSIIVLSITKDKQFDNAATGAWSSAEINLGIVCACMTALRPLLARFLPAVFRTTHEGSMSSTQPTLSKAHAAASRGNSVARAQSIAFPGFPAMGLADRDMSETKVSHGSSTKSHDPV